MNNSILDLAQIKIKLTGKMQPLAKVALNWNGEFEVRFFRINRRTNGSLWFQPPALAECGWAKCFIVENKINWKKLEKRVLDTFFKCLKEEGIYSKEFIENLERGNEDEKINIDDIPDTFT